MQCVAGRQLISSHKFVVDECLEGMWLSGVFFFHDSGGTIFVGTEV